MLKKLCVFLLIFSYGVSQAETSNCTIGELLNNLTATRSSVSPYKINDYKKYPVALKIGEKGFFDINALIKRLDKQPILKAKLKRLKKAGVKRIEVTLKSKKKPEELTSIQRFIQKHLNNYDNTQTLAYFESPEIGKFEIYSVDLLNDMTTVKDFSNLSDFKKGEFIHFNTTDKDLEFDIVSEAGIVIKNYDNTPTSLALPGNTHNLHLKFEKPISEEEYLVSITPQEGQVDKVFLKVKRSLINRSFPDQRKIVQKQLAALDSINLIFTKGEKIRFRTETGSLVSGKILKANSNGTYNILHNKKEVEVSKGGIFKDLNSDFSTPYYKSKKFPFSSKPEDLYEKILNGAAKITSTPEYKSFSQLEQVELLTQYLVNFIQKSDIAKTSEAKGFNSLNKIVCTGVAVCRHNSTALGTILKEAGFDVHLMHYINPKKNAGHAWLQVEIDHKTYVLDGNLPGDKYYLDTLDKVINYSKKNPDAFESMFFSQKGREELIPTTFD